MPAPLATAADIEASGHPVTDTDVEAQLDRLLRLGSALLRLRFDTIDARIANGELDGQLVVDVLVGVVLRAPSFVNPEGIRSESVGDDTYSVTYDGVRSSGGGMELWLTAQDVALLAPLQEYVPIFGSARLRPMLS